MRNSIRLNDVLVNKCKEGWNRANMEFELSPETDKELSNEDFVNILVGTANIASEIDQYRGSHRKLSTRVEHDSIIMEFLSSGVPLNQETINRLNRSYDGEQIHNFKLSGSYHIGDYFRKVNGVVRIENCDENPYTVRNVVTLPR